MMNVRAKRMYEEFLTAEKTWSVCSLFRFLWRPYVSSDRDRSARTHDCPRIHIAGYGRSDAHRSCLTDKRGLHDLSHRVGPRQAKRNRGNDKRVRERIKSQTL